MTEQPDGDIRAICPDDALLALTARLGTDEVQAMLDLDGLARRYPADARLPFLKGSVLAGARRYEEATAALEHAVDLAPDYAVARFQLGFLRYTSGAPADADRIWAPLLARSEDDVFRLFAAGLGRLAVDDVAGALRLLRQGIANNDQQLPQLNGDMQLIIDELLRQTGEPDAEAEADTEVSETQLLLMQHAAKPTRH